MEIATTSAQRERGLMFRQSMPKDAGMLFLFDPPEPAAFWMKNTYIPLDILFIRADGTIAKIKEGAMPFDLMPVDSAGPVKYVIELNGGEARVGGLRRGIKSARKNGCFFQTREKNKPEIKNLISGFWFMSSALRDVLNGFLRFGEAFRDFFHAGLLAGLLLIGIARAGDMGHQF